MFRQGRSPTRLIAVGALAAAVAACGDTRTPTGLLSPSDAPSLAQGGNMRVKIKTLQLSANTLRIEGPAASASMSIGNSGLAIQQSVSYRAEIVQGGTTRQAAKGPTQCNPGDSPGFLPAGNCDMTVPVSVSNSALGNGILVPGAAVLVMHILETTVDGQNELANKSVAVNLVATPSITSLTLSPTTLAIGGPRASWTATLQNPANSLQNVLLQGYMVQGATRQPAGGVSVSCGSAIGVLSPGTCTVSFTAGAANGVGTGTLVPGPATFELNLMQSSGGTNTTFDTKTVAVTLVSSTPTIASLVLASTSIVIGGQTDYTAQIQNYGFPLTDVFIQGEMFQDTDNGTVQKGAGGTVLTCGASQGALPTGTCTQQFTAGASSDAQGGSLVPGLARFVLHLYKSNGIDVAPTELDVKTVEVTLVSPIPTITSIVPTSSYVVLGSGFTTYTATIQNPGGPRSVVLVQNWIRQGTARRAGGGSNVNCSGSPGGTLPTGTCSTLADIVASNDPIIGGTGTLVLGPATLEVELKYYDGTTETILDTESIPITLVASTPSIVSIDFTSTTIAIGGQSRYTATLYNPTGSTLTGSLIQGTITQGSNSAPAGGVTTSCPSNGQVAPGSCVISFTANPNNANSFPGPLVPGAATFTLQFYQNGTVLDSKSVAITLTSP
jgi:hypothetical protein